MTKRLDLAMELARRLPDETQDAIARLVFEIADDQRIGELPSEHAEAIGEGLAEADRGDFATDEEVEAVLRRFSR